MIKYGATIRWPDENFLRTANLMGKTTTTVPAYEECSSSRVASAVVKQRWPRSEGRDRGRVGWGLWMYREAGTTQPGHPNSRTKSRIVVLRYSVPRSPLQSRGDDQRRPHRQIYARKTRSFLAWPMG
jgi:hypothetical protein